jgi:hypothetical protein
MEEDELSVASAPSDESCPRCLEPVPSRAARCPQCGQPISSFRRIAPVLAGVAGILALIFLCVMVYRVVYVPEQDQAPVVDQQAAPDGTFAAPPETSSGHETPPPEPSDAKPASPPEAPKKAPLDR